VKNREAAQLFRQRQKAYIQDLEKKVHDLAVDNNEFRARVELLNSENKLIKDQLLYLRNFVTQAVSFSFPKVGSLSSTSGMPTLGGIPASIASLALGTLASSGNIAGLLGPLPPGLFGPSNSLSLIGPNSISSACSSTSLTNHHPNLSHTPTPPHSLQQVPQRPVSPVISIDPTRSPLKASAPLNLTPHPQLAAAGAASK